MNAAAVNGTWVLLQNCELGLGLMNEMEASFPVPPPLLATAVSTTDIIVVDARSK